MPTHKVKGGYQWGKHGKIYPTKKQADKQGQAIYASGWKENKTNENMKQNKKLIRLTESDLHNIIKESVNKILKENFETEAFSDIYQPHNFSDPNKDYYNGYVIVDGTRAVLGQYDNYDEAVEDANEMARQNKYGTYEVYGCDKDGYALEEDYPEDNTLVYSTDELENY